jgi:CHAT domain-containing protein
MSLARLGDLYFREKQFPEAEKHYSQIAPDKPKAESLDVQKQVRKATDVKNKPGNTKNRVESIGRSVGGIFSRKPSRSTVGDVASTADSAVNTAQDVTETVTGVVEDIHRANLLLKSYCLSDISLGRVALAQGNEAKAQERFESALKFATRYPPFFGKNPTSKRFQIIALTDLGDMAFAQNRFADAAKSYADARDRARSFQRPDLSWPASRGIGRSQWAIALAEGEKDLKSPKFPPARDAALGAYRDSISAIEELRGQSIRGDEARQSFSAQTVAVYSEYVDLLAALALQWNSHDTAQPLSGDALRYAAEAFKVAEGRKSRALLDLMAETGTEITTGIDPALLEKRKTSLDRQTELSDQLIGLSGESRDTTTRDDEALEREIDELAVESANLEAQIRTSSPQYAALTSPAPLTLQDAQSKLLDENTILLEYYLGEKRSLLWAVGPGNVWLFSLAPAQEIEPRVTALRDLLLASANAVVAEPVAPAPPPESRTTKAPAKRATPAAKAPLPAPPAKPTARRPARDLKMVRTPEPPPLRPLEENAEARKYAETAFNLYFALLRPVGDIIRGKRLLLVLDGVLNYLPFESLVTSLPVPGGDPPADFAALNYLVRNHEISYAPSATVLAALKTGKSGKPPGKAALILGDPVFELNDPRIKKGAQQTTTESSQRDLLLKQMTNAGPAPSPAAPAATSAPAPSPTAGTPALTASAAARLGIPRLPATRNETNEIAKILKQSGTPVDLFQDLLANEELFRTRNLSNYRFLHLATHGMLNSEHPENSGLVLSLVGNPADSDGFLRTREIFNLRLSSPLVMLSACKTGLGQLRKGEGVIGLTRAFLYAGASGIGVSLWPVDDNSTALLMTDFYGRQFPSQTASSPPAGALRPAAALRAAQMRLIEQRQYSAPFFWAPFILVGDPQ